MKPEIRIFQNLEILSRSAAHLIIAQAEESIRERGRFLIVLNGGGTPQRLFQLLASEYREKIDWAHTHIFWGDERCVPPDDAESSYGLARGLLLSKVNVPDENIHRIKADLGPDAASRDYANTLSIFRDPPLEWPHFDLVQLGMGEDGHTASLFPGSPIDVKEPVLGVTAHYQNRPAQRVTLTPPVFNSARMIIFMATGSNKAVTLSRVLSDKYEIEDLPAQRIDPKDGRLTWLVDEDAASKLPRKIKGLRICEG